MIKEAIDTPVSGRSLTFEQSAEVMDEIMSGKATLKCLRCGHSWYPKGPALPKVCSKCKSPYRNKPKWKGINKT